MKQPDHITQAINHLQVLLGRGLYQDDAKVVKFVISTLQRPYAKKQTNKKTKNKKGTSSGENVSDVRI